MERIPRGIYTKELREENVKNICTTVFHINESDSPDEEIRLYDDGRNSYLIAINRQVREDYEEAKEIYRQLSKIIDRDPSHKKGWLSLALLREWIYLYKSTNDVDIERN